MRMWSPTGHGGDGDVVNELLKAAESPNPSKPTKGLRVPPPSLILHMPALVDADVRQAVDKA
jgi:hypothetical protein